MVAVEAMICKRNLLSGKFAMKKVTPGASLGISLILHNILKYKNQKYSLNNALLDETDVTFLKTNAEYCLYLGCLGGKLVHLGGEHFPDTFFHMGGHRVHYS